jgi:hypothetical protein
MKKILLFFALLAIATMATAQIKITTSGSVYIGTPDYTWVGCKLKINYGANNITFMPDWSGSNLGTNVARLDFWHPETKWNKVGFKNYSLHSDSTAKTEITPLENATTILKQIKTYSYFFKSDSLEIRSDSVDLRKREYGVLAQEIEEFLPDLVDTVKGTMLVNYNAFIAMLIKGFNEQQTVIETQQIELGILSQVVLAQELDILKLKQLQTTVSELQKMLYECCEPPKGMPMPTQIEEPLPEGAAPILYQNAPNPFTSNTEISCYLPETATQATIYIYNLQGIELKSYPLTQLGLNTLIVYGSEFSAGMYLYTLIVGNKIIDTKRMVLTK